MIVTFEKEYLKELYECGKTNDKKHRYQPDIVKRFQERIKLLVRATDTKELLLYNSLHYEELKGDKHGICSIRVNKKYRIEFSVEETLTKPIITICNIIELSNHYN